VLVLPIFGFAVLGREAMVTLAGDKYAGGGLVLALIMCSVGLACLQGVFGNALVTQGKQSKLLKVSISVLVANGIVNLVAIPLFGDVGASSALLATEGLSLALTLGVYHGFAPLPRVHAPLKLAAALGSLVAVAVACIVISSSTVAMLIAIVLGISVYAGVLIALRALPGDVSAPIAAMLRSLRPRRAT
jgi:O-antigen/teichoic acid export membrane protein